MTDTIVFTFGRFSPPTISHEYLIQSLLETAKSLHANHMIYLSQTHKAPSDPLEWNFKRRICESAFRGVNISKDKTIRTPYQALEQLKENYNNIVMVVGSDRIDEFRKNFTPYTKEWEIDFEVVCAGERILESDGIVGMSATKLRQYAREGNKIKFFEGLPKTLNDNIKELVYQNTCIGIRPQK